MRPSPDFPRWRNTPRRGSAVLIILVLLACIGILVAANSDILAALKQELRLLDHHQMKKYGSSTGH
jgi:hypothetical protein